MAKKAGEEKKYNHYSRREVLKAGARVGASAAFYGTIGHFLGRGYQEGKEWYAKNIQPTEKEAREGVHELRGKYDNLKREAKILLRGEKAVVEEENRKWEVYRQRINNQREEKQKENQEVLSRRALLRYPLTFAKQIHENPTTTLTLTGIAYGGIKSTIKAIPRYLNKREFARLKDRNTEYEERISILENYKRRMEQSQERDTEEVRKESERVGGLLDSAGRASGKLEIKVTEKSEDKVPLIAIGLTGLLASFILNISKISGFIVAEDVFIKSLDLSIFLFLASLILIFIATRKKKTKIVQKNQYKFS